MHKYKGLIVFKNTALILLSLYFYFITDKKAFSLGK